MTRLSSKVFAMDNIKEFKNDVQIEAIDHSKGELSKKSNRARYLVCL